MGWSQRSLSTWCGADLKDGERPEDLRLEVAPLGGGAGGPIVGLGIIGFYPPGSAGNEHAEAIKRRVADLRSGFAPAAVVIDLTRMDYVWGNGLGGALMPLFSRTDGRSPVVALVATGRTGKAVRSFFDDRTSELLGLRVFDDREAALRHLVSETTVPAGG